MIFPAPAGVLRCWRVTAATTPLFPRSAGMFPGICTRRWNTLHYPRTCGDDPLLEGYGCDNPGFPCTSGDVPEVYLPHSWQVNLSPHARGCSRLRVGGGGRDGTDIGGGRTYGLAKRE